jgi:retron-type reverse transcriptase
LSGVHRVAQETKQEQFTALPHHVMGLEDRLIDLHSRVYRGTYRAQPSRRVYIPKADGRQRPLGIAALEVKLVQQAVVTVLNEIYEMDFKGFSYGFRPGRNAHEALDALNAGLRKKRVNWILDADIKGFFDHVSHEWLLEFIGHRVADNRVLRLIAGSAAKGNRKHSRSSGSRTTEARTRKATLWSGDAHWQSG